MLVIRLQRRGRKKVAHFRIVVQDSRRTPTSGNVIAYLGHYNPHSKELVVDKDAALGYLKNGAHPSPKIIVLFEKEKIELPSWVKKLKPKTRATRNPEKRRSTAPLKEVEEESKESSEAQKEETEVVDSKEAEDTSQEESSSSK